MSASAAAKPVKGKKPSSSSSSSKNMSKTSKVGKAKTTSKNVKQVKSIRKAKIRFTPHFHRPKTLRRPRTPKYVRSSLQTVSTDPVVADLLQPLRKRMDKYQIIQAPVTTESAMKKIEEINTLVFLVDMRANKHQIKQAVKELYDVAVAKVNTLNKPGGAKKAYVRLTPDYDALDVANKIGII
eukprot:GHVT01046783.1.p1 GENE.GHVT01046783.1~~GHVT01046783.1.p1  ORF type:complete len:183 (+),score=55.68 GHVT01046783.1:89-637(+)